MITWNTLPNGDIIIGKENTIIRIDNVNDIYDFYDWLDSSKGQEKLQKVDGDNLLKLYVWETRDDRKYELVAH